MRFRLLGRRDAARLEVAAGRLRDLIIAQRRFLFVRVEESFREMEFLPDGSIGIGSGPRERTWTVESRRGKAVLLISGPAGEICQLELEDTGVWRGRWLKFEKLQVLLLPAPPVVSFQPKISFYTTCMGRLHHLKLTLPVNIRSALACGNVEFVLLDYNSPDGLEDWVREELSSHIQSGVVVYYKTTRPKAYDSSRAKNAAARLTTGDIICNLDADNWLGLGFAQHLAQLLDAPRTLVRAERPWGGVFGRIALYRQDFLMLGGYDESFSGYGFDDTDFINRARAAGFVDKRFAQKYALCLSHSNAERTENMGLDKNATHRQNKQQSARNIAAGRLVANVGKPWGQEPVVKNFGELVSV